MARDLNSLFNPKSIAVIGASEHPSKVGSVALQNIITSGYKGKIFPINPHVENIGLMKFYSEISLLPEIPDLVVIAVPATIAVTEIKKSALFGVKNFVVFSAGFKETGVEGQKLEQELINLSNEHQLNILGPNCLGFASPESSLNITFGQVIKKSKDLKIISQSGAITTGFFDYCQSLGIGFESCVTLGNKSVINENDILNFWAKNISPIGLYLESISQGQEFIKLISQITPHQPVFILKPGKSEEAATAMKSHTGSIATSDYVFNSALHHVGAIRCHELGDFFEIAKIISEGKIPAGPRVAVVTNAGGPAVLATDTIDQSGLKLAKLSSDSRQKLAAILPSISSLNNPIDLLGDALANRFSKSLEIIIADPNVDSILVILTPQLMTQVTQTSQAIADVQLKTSKPILSSFIPSSFPERQIKVLSSLWFWQQWRQSKPQSISPKTLPVDQIKEVLHQELKNQIPENLLSTLSIPTPKTSFINTLDEALQFVAKNNYPVVLKVSSANLLHKTEVGGVILNIDSPQKLSLAFNRLISISSTLQIQTQIDNGVEIILGFKRDPTFGPIILFGAGGKFAEIILDRNISLLPLTNQSIRELVTNSLVSKLLSGFRGDTAYNLDSLYTTMQTLSQLFLDFPEISEIEINPLILTHHGIFALDPKIIIK